MNELISFCIICFFWGIILMICGGICRKILSGVGLCLQIIGCIFTACPFVIAAIGVSATVITGLANAISALI